MWSPKDENLSRVGCPELEVGLLRIAVFLEKGEQDLMENVERVYHKSIGFLQWEYSLLYLLVFLRLIFYSFIGAFGLTST